MSLLLAVASMYIAGKVVAEVGKDLTKVPARSKIQEASKQGNFDVVDSFEEILKICEVKRKKFNSTVPVLPNTGYTKCLEFIRNHHLTTPADEERFIQHYRKVLANELSDRQTEYDKHYREVEAEVRFLMGADDYEVVRFEHLNAYVDYEDVEQKVTQIKENTFFGLFLIGDVKIKQSNAVFKEIWAVKIPVAMKFKLEDFYMACAERCGYIY